MDFSGHQFHPVIQLPKKYSVLDLSGITDTKPPSTDLFTIGRYNEKRPATYKQELFSDGRDIHMGIDLGAPALTPIYAFADGEILHTADNKLPGDYGPTLVTGHRIGKIELFALWGHLTRNTLDVSRTRKKFLAGDCLGHIGDTFENGGWPPHLHFQLCWERPNEANLPGVVHSKDHELALKMFPDPRIVLGPIY